MKNRKLYLIIIFILIITNSLSVGLYLNKKTEILPDSNTAEQTQDSTSSESENLVNSETYLFGRILSVNTATKPANLILQLHERIVDDAQNARIRYAEGLCTLSQVEDRTCYQNEFHPIQYKDIGKKVTLSLSEDVAIRVFSIIDKYRTQPDEIGSYKVSVNAFKEIYEGQKQAVVPYATDTSYIFTIKDGKIVSILEEMAP